MQKNNSFFVFPQLVHHVVGYLSELAVAMDELLACEKSYENLLQSAVYVVRYDFSNLPDDVDMLVFLSFSGLYNQPHDIECHTNVHERHKRHHLEHLQVHHHIQYKSNARNYNE